MAEAAKKEYTIKINGIAEEIKNTQTLSDALMKLDANVRTLNRTNLDLVKTVKTKTAALSDEEKAEQRVTNTIRKAVHARSDLGRAQAEATQALREINKEVAREIKINNEAEGSIKQKTLQLAAMKDAYRSLSEEQRNNESVGGVMLANIQELDKETKALNGSIGDFHANVGNYPNVDKFSKKLSEINSTGVSLIQMFTLGTGVLSLFGAEIDKDDKVMKNLHKVMGLLMISQSALNNLNKKGAVIKGIMTLQEKAHAKATALTTSHTIAATVAQRIFNAVAKANPYLLLVTGIAAVVGSLALFSSKTKDSTEETKEYTSAIDGMKFASEEARDAHDSLMNSINNAQTDYDLATGDITEYGAKLREFANKQVEIQKKIYEWRQKKIEEILDEKNGEDGFLPKSGETSEAAVARIEREIDEAIEETYKLPLPQEIIDEQTLLVTQIKTEQVNQKNYVKNINDSNSLALIVDEEEAELKKLKKVYDDEVAAAETRNKEIRAANILADTEHQVPEIDISKIRTKYYKDEKAIRDKYAKKRSDEEKRESEKRIANEKKNWDTIIETEELGTQLITNEYDRRNAEIDIRWKKERQDIIDRLAEEKDLSEEARKSLYDRLITIDKIAAADLRKVEEDRINRSVSDNYEGYQKLLADHEKFMKKFSGEEGIIKRKGPLNLIDIKGTKENIVKVNKELSDELVRLKTLKTELLISHDNNLANFMEGTEEFEQEVERYTKASDRIDEAIKNTQASMDNNEESSNNLLSKLLEDLMDQYGDEIEMAQKIFNMASETFVMGVQFEIDTLKKELESINEQYDKAKERQDESASRIEELTQRMQDSSGGASEAIREQIMEEMALKNELDREEQRLAKEKEKRDEMLAKKESQLKRKEHLSKMAEATASAALALIKCYDLGPIVGSIAAVMIGAITAAQLGIMAAQLTKLEDGGMIEGPSHAAGGVRIPGTNIEVEGREFVINKQSTASNPALVRFINDSRRTVTMADLVGVIPSGSHAPSLVPEVKKQADDRIIGAIKEINFSPYVVVTDIENAGMDVVRVRDRSGL